MQLIPNVARAVRLWSVQVLATIALLNGAWAASPQVQALLPGEVVSWVNFALAIVGGVLRVIAQTPVPEAPRE